MSHAEERYALAYSRGQERASGVAFTPPSCEWERGAIARVILAHAPKLKGDALTAWIEDWSCKYREAINPEDARFHGGYAPKSWERWMNSRDVKVSVSRERPYHRPYVPEHTECATKEHALAACGDILETLRRMG